MAKTTRSGGEKRSGARSRGKGAVDGEAGFVHRYIARRLFQLRKELGLTQAALADILQVSHQQIGKYEDAGDRISAGALFLLCTALGVSPSYFYIAGAPARDRPGLSDAQQAVYAAEPDLAEHIARLVQILERVPNRGHRQGLVELLDVASRHELWNAGSQSREPASSRK